ncbi:unnamed protein product, partial [Iphiclides podalirius]
MWRGWDLGRAGAGASACRGASSGARADRVALCWPGRDRCGRRAAAECCTGRLRRPPRTAAHAPPAPPPARPTPRRFNPPTRTDLRYAAALSSARFFYPSTARGSIRTGSIESSWPARVLGSHKSVPN